MGANRIVFYAVVFVLVAGIGYLGFRLISPDSVQTSEKNSKDMKSHAHADGSNTTTAKDSTTAIKQDSIWADSRLQSLGGLMKAQANLKLSAELENNLKVVLDSFENGMKEDAYDQLDKMIASHPDDPSYRAIKSDLLYNDAESTFARDKQMELYADAEKNLRDLLSHSKDNSFLEGRLGETLLKQGKTEDAEQEFRRALAQNPGTGNALEGLFKVFETKTDWQSAQTEKNDYLNRALQAQPNGSYILKLAAENAAAEGDFNKVAEYSKRALQSEVPTQQRLELLQLSYQAAVFRKDAAAAKEFQQTMEEITKAEEEKIRSSLSVNNAPASPAPAPAPKQ